jgi:hypothetical protein
VHPDGQESPTVKALFTVLAIVTSIAAGAVQESTVLSVSAKPANARAGTPVSVTAAGKGFCGAVHIDWGDGTAITYPTSTLPVAQSHAYQYGGTYTIRAQGMANCSGQATTSVRIDGPPPPPPPPPAAPAPPSPPDKKSPSVSGLEITTPRDAGPNVRAIRVEGTGTCAYTLDFGDGNSEGRNAPLPDVVRHNYPAQGRYTVAATPAAPCTGGGRSTVVIGGAARGTVVGVDVRPEAGVGAQVVVIVQGSGQCTVAVDFDDGTQREVTGTLPARVTHRFERSGSYEVVAWGQTPCTGGGSATVRVR